VQVKLKLSLWPVSEDGWGERGM